MAEKEYIERETVVELFNKLSHGYSYIEVPTRDAIACVRVIPAADVRPVVLCRDCIFRSDEWMGCPKINGTITGDEFFCKCGIKREES